MMSKFNDVAYLSINVKGTNIFVTVTKSRIPKIYRPIKLL